MSAYFIIQYTRGKVKYTSHEEGRDERNPYWDEKKFDQGCT